MQAELRAEKGIRKQRREKISIDKYWAKVYFLCALSNAD
jgi:hypothetical protein